MIDRETEGNPFFVEEVYLHLVESGVLLDEHGRVRPDLRLDEASVPESIRLVLGQRLDRLAVSTREVLVAAAVSGRTFASDLVGEVAGANQDALLEAFDEAERARLVTPGKDPGQLMFSHELIRQTLLSGVSAVKRERLHLQGGQTQSRGATPTTSRRTPAISPTTCPVPDAFGDRASLVRYLTIAGDRAFDAAAFDDAVGHFEHALSLMPTDDQLGHAQLLERLAMALRSVGRWDDALRTMNECPGPLRGARQDGGHRPVGLGHGVPAGVDRPVCRRSTGWPADAGGTRRHRQRRQGASAVSDGICHQRQRRLRRGDGHVRPGACAC